MEKSKNIFQLLDQQIFAQIDTYKKSQLYQKLNDSISSFDDTAKNVSNKVLTTFALLTPIIIVILFNSSNNTLRHELEIKSEIYSLINSYQSKKANIEKLGRRVLSPQIITDKSSLQKRFDRVLTRKSIDSERVTISKFNQDSSLGSITKTTAKISFKMLSTTKLSDLLSSLLQSEKVKVSKLIIKRNNKTEQIKGSFSIVHFGKAK